MSMVFICSSRLWLAWSWASFYCYLGLPLSLRTSGLLLFRKMELCMDLDIVRVCPCTC
jgi:hypothetical protein